MAQTFETLLVEIRLNGASVTKAQLKEIREEVRQVEGAFASLATLGGLTLALAQITEIAQAFGQVSGLNIAAQFQSVAYSLEAVVGNSQKAAGLWRELKALGNQIGIDPQTLGKTAALMAGSGVPTEKIAPELRTIMDAMARANVRSEDMDSFLFNLQQIRGMGSAKANFMDIRQMITRAPGIQRILASGLGVKQTDLMSTLRGKDLSGSEVYSALMKGAEAMAKGAAEARALRDPLFAVAGLFLTLKQVMEPTGKILLALGMPVLKLARGMADMFLKVNELTGGLAGMAALIGGGLFIATRTATAALWDFVKAMAGTAVAARTAGAAQGTAATAGIGGSIIGGAAAGGAAALPWYRQAGMAGVTGFLAALGGTIVKNIIPILGWSYVAYEVGRQTFDPNAKGGFREEAETQNKKMAEGMKKALGIKGKDELKATNPIVDEQKKTNKLLEEMKLRPMGGGPQSARAISDFEASYALARMMEI